MNIARLILQTTTTSAVEGEYAGYWASGDWFTAIAQPFMDLLGPVAPLMLGLGLGGMLFVWSGTLALPIVVFMLIGSMIIPLGPPQMQVAGYLLIMFGGALGAWKAYMGGGRR